VYLSASQGKLCSGTVCSNNASSETLNGGPTLSIDKDEPCSLPHAESPLNNNTNFAAQTAFEHLSRVALAADRTMLLDQ
jgi:hypothetical protein